MRHPDFCSFCLDYYSIIHHSDWFWGYFGFGIMTSVRKTAKRLNLMQRIITEVENMYGKKYKNHYLNCCSTSSADRKDTAWAWFHVAAKCMSCKNGAENSYFRKLLFRPFFCFKCHFKGHKNDLIDYNWPVVSGTCSPSPVDSVQLSVCSGHEYHQEQALRLTWLKTRDDPHNHSCQCHTYRFNYTNPMPSNQQFGLVQKRPSSMTEGWRGGDGRKRNGKFRDLVNSLKNSLSPPYQSRLIINYIKHVIKKPSLTYPTVS